MKVKVKTMEEIKRISSEVANGIYKEPNSEVIFNEQMKELCEHVLEADDETGTIKSMWVIVPWMVHKELELKIGDIVRDRTLNGGIESMYEIVSENEAIDYKNEIFTYIFDCRYDLERITDSEIIHNFKYERLKTELVDKEWKRAEEEVTESCMEVGAGNRGAPNVKEELSGSDGKYYDLPKGSVQLQDLIEHKQMNFSIGNIFKAVYRLGEKDQVSQIYDLEKIIFFAKRELNRVK